MTQINITLDAKHVAIRDDDSWVITRLQPQGHYDMIESWQGPRRSIFHVLERLDVHPTRQAEAQLAALPERRAFRGD